MKKVGCRTPWGKAQDVVKHSDEIFEVSTAGHGGFWLAARANKRVPEAFRAKGGWYEGDCNWVHAVMYFPEVFSAEKVEDAKRAFAWEQENKRISEEFHEQNKNNYVATSAWGDWDPRVPTGMVGVLATLGCERTAAAYENGKYFLLSAEDYSKRGKFGYVINLETDKEWDQEKSFHEKLDKWEEDNK